MKNPLRVFVILFVVCAPCAYADSIPLLNVNITYVTASMGPNAGIGDNISFTLIGPGTIITGYGGMACPAWCSGVIPDLSSVSTSQIFVGAFTGAIVKGKAYDAYSDLSLCCVFSPDGGLNPSSDGFVGEGDTYAEVNLTLPCCGGWNLQFEYFPPEGDFAGGYQFVRGEFSAGTLPAPVPEPGTLGLMATGLAGVVGVIRGKRFGRRGKTG